MSGPTLVELLEEEANWADDMCTDTGEQFHAERAASLRAAAARLRSEMKAQGDHRFKSTHALEAWMALERVNGGPLDTRSEPTGEKETP